MVERLKPNPRDFRGYSLLVQEIFPNDETRENLQEIFKDPAEMLSLMNTVDDVVSGKTLEGKPEHMQKLRLNKKEQDAIRAKFSLWDDFKEEVSDKEVSRQIGKGVSKDKAKKITQSALQKLRHPSIALAVFRVLNTH